MTLRNTRVLHALRLAAVALLLAACVPAGAVADDLTRSPSGSTATSTTTTVAPIPNPLAARPLHVASWTSAGAAADRIRSTRPADAAELDVLAETPAARWFGDWSGDVRAAADAYVGEAVRANRMPVLVAYNIHRRDCGAHSSGGAASPTAYRQWIAELAAGIGSRPAAVILEPDAVALVECLSASERITRNALLADAITTLAANPRTAVYLDAGHPGWLTADEAARRLRDAGVSGARGVSLNVSNFQTTAANVAYAEALHARLGVYAVIGTDRNGLGPAVPAEWCNPPGRALGDRPTATTGSRVVDAFLWIKVPGESDGECGRGEPPAGTFWIDYALGLVDRAA